MQRCDDSSGPSTLTSIIPPAPSTATTLKYKSWAVAPPIKLPAQTIVSAVVYPVPVLGFGMNKLFLLHLYQIQILNLFRL